MPDQLRIAMVAACPFPFRRGTPVRIQRMSEALSGRGHDVHVATYHLGDRQATNTFRIHRAPRVPTYQKTSPGPSYQKVMVLDPLLVLTLRRLLSRYAFDVIHAHHCEGMLVAKMARRRRSLPIVFDVHTLLESELPYYGLGLTERLKAHIGRRLDRYLPRQSDHTIAVSDDIRDRMVQADSVQPDRVSVIPNGVELDVFEVAPTVSNRNDGSRTVVFTGNMAPYQGIDLMLEAFRAVRDLRDDVRLSIVTDASFEPYEAQARALGVRSAIDVHSTGFQGVPPLLAAAEIALNPRVDCAGLPQKLLNYMAAGKPVVSFAGSAKHLVDGEHGLTIRDGDTQAFAQAINRLLNDRELSARMGEASREFVRRNLSWEATAARVEAVYERLL